MPNGHGGRRPPPRRPQPPSGPGRFANRGGADGQGGITPQPIATPTGQPYGDDARLRGAQRVAPAPSRRSRPSSAPPPPGARRGGAGAAPLSLLELIGQQTRRPDEPITSGLPIGPGPGPEALLPESPADTGPAANPDLIALANDPDASPEFRSMMQLAALIKALQP